MIFVFFFFNDTATTEIYTLSLHDALPIYVHWLGKGVAKQHEWTFRMYSADNTEGRDNRTSFYLFNLGGDRGTGSYVEEPVTDRKSTRLNSSHANISYAVFCLKKKKTNTST